MINDYIHLRQQELQDFFNICGSMIDANAKKYKDYTPGVGKFLGRLGYTPSDIVVADTIPLRQVCVVNDDSNNAFLFDYDTSSDHEKCKVVGTLTSEGVQDLYATTPVVIMHDEPEFLLIDARTIGFFYGDRQINPPNEYARETHELFSQMQMVWYGIQIALLNPYVKDIFRTETIRKTAFNSNGKKRKSVVKYIRHHYLNPGALSPKTEAGQMLRKTMAWYVVGHWRHYQDGKTIFIQPYWKGPLRETKVCEPRERKVV